MPAFCEGLIERRFSLLSDRRISELETLSMSGNNTPQLVEMYGSSLDAKRYRSSRSRAIRQPVFAHGLLQPITSGKRLLLMVRHRCNELLQKTQRNENALSDSRGRLTMQVRVLRTTLR